MGYIWCRHAAKSSIYQYTYNDVIQKYCIQKVHKNVQFCNRKGYRYTAYRYTAVIYVILGAFA